MFGSCVNPSIDHEDEKRYTSIMNAQDVLEKCKRVAKKRGLTYQRIGERMGYAPESARQSVSQFLNGRDPTVQMLLRFCKASGIDPKRVL